MIDALLFTLAFYGIVFAAPVVVWCLGKVLRGKGRRAKCHD